LANRTFGQEKTHGLIVDYIGIFDDVAQALAFDEKSVRLVVSNIDELRKVLPVKMQKCLAYFPGVDRTVGGYEGLMAAQQHLPNNEVRDKFAAEYTVLANISEALSPDPCLSANLRRATANLKPGFGPRPAPTRSACSLRLREPEGSFNFTPCDAGFDLPFARTPSCSALCWAAARRARGKRTRKKSRISSSARAASTRWIIPAQSRRLSNRSKRTRSRRRRTLNSAGFTRKKFPIRPRRFITTNGI
jgi:hypothetical protein